MSDQKYAGQLALVTGASRGIGAATAEALADAGAHVVLTGRDTKALEAVEERIFAAGGAMALPGWLPLFPAAGMHWTFW